MMNGTAKTTFVELARMVGVVPIFLLLLYMSKGFIRDTISLEGYARADVVLAIAEEQGRRTGVIDEFRLVQAELKERSKQIEGVQATTADTNRDVEEIKRDVGVLKNEVQNLNEQGDKIDKKLDLLLEDRTLRRRPQ